MRKKQIFKLTLKIRIVIKVKEIVKIWRHLDFNWERKLVSGLLPKLEVKGFFLQICFKRILLF